MGWDEMDDEAQNDELEQNEDGTVTVLTDEERRKRREIVKSRGMDGQKAAWRGDDRSALEKAVASAAPEAISEPRCATCQSPHREWIEHQLVMGMSYKRIADQIVGGPSRKSISNHFVEHMALAKQAIRAELEAEASTIGQDVDAGVRGAITMRGMLAVLIQKGYQDAVNSVTDVEPKDMAQFIKIYNELNEDSGTAAVEEAKLVINVFKEAIQNVLIKGDIIERALGMQLLQAISDEVIALREEQEVDKEFERNLLPPAATAS
jgi:hypothetical protein